MRERLDAWVDTREKRYMAFGCIAVAALLWLLVPYLILGIRLLSIRAYADVFSLLKDPLLSHTYVSRVVLLCLEQAELGIVSFAMCLYRAISFPRLLLLLPWLLISGDKQMRLIRRIFGSTLLIGVAVIAFCALNAFGATTLMEAVAMMKYIGAVLSLMSAIQILTHVFALIFIYGRGYRRALRFTVMEYSEAQLYQLMREES